MGLVPESVSAKIVAARGWVTMPKYNADGTVIEVTLNTVKVRNFDNTIITIPPYALVSDSFQNWRGMRESGGRRVKRSVNLDVNSVCFCTPEMLERYKKIVILKEYIEQTEQKVQQYNQQQGIDDSVPVNGVHQTNLGVFRAYLELYLKNLPVVNSDLTYMVRPLTTDRKRNPFGGVFLLQRERLGALGENPGRCFRSYFCGSSLFWSKSIPKSFFCRYSPGFRKSVIGVLYKTIRFFYKCILI